MKIRYVEAMVDEEGSKELDEAVRALMQKANRADIEWSEFDAVEDAADGIAVSCLVPVATSETIGVQMERAGFLRAEEVAIVRLADLKALIAAAGAEARVA